MLYQGYKALSTLLFTYSRRENSWIHTFLWDINALCKANSLVKDLNSGRHIHFPLHHKYCEVCFICLLIWKRNTIKKPITSSQCNVFSFFLSWHINLRGLFNVKAIFVEKQKRYYLTHNWEVMGLVPFPRILFRKWMLLCDWCSNSFTWGRSRGYRLAL